MTRFPLAELLGVTGLSQTQVARRCGVSGTDIAIAAEDGLTVIQADHWAIRLGRHPGGVWPDWWTVELEVEPDVCGRGHLREGNTYTAPDNSRHCRVCANERRRKKETVAA